MSAFGVAVDEECVCIFEAGVAKDAALDRLVTATARASGVADTASIEQAVRGREASQSTAIGGGVAIPHAYTEAVTRPCIGVGISRAGLALAGTEPGLVHVVVFFLMPASANRQYLELLAQLMVAMKAPNFLNRLAACEAPAEVIAILNESGG